MSKRNLLLDLVKGIGIVLVVFGHSGILLGHYMIYMFHMPLFFFVSGMLHKDRDVSTLLKEKSFKMLKTYLLFFVLCTLVDLVLRGNDYIKDISVFNPQGSAGPLWFLISLFEANIVFAMIRKYAKSYYLTVCFALTAIGFILYKTGVPLPCFMDSTLSIMAFYGLGYAIHSKDDKRLLCMPWYVSAFLFLLMYFLDYKVFHLNVNDIFDNVIMDNCVLYLLSAWAGIALTFSTAHLLLQHFVKINSGGGNFHYGTQLIVYICDAYVDTKYLSLHPSSRQ